MMSSKADRNPRDTASAAVEEPQVFGSIARNTARAQHDHSGATQASKTSSW